MIIFTMFMLLLCMTGTALSIAYILLKMCQYKMYDSVAFTLVALLVICFFVLLIVLLNVPSSYATGY